MIFKRIFFLNICLVVLYFASYSQAPIFTTEFSNCFGGSEDENFFGGTFALDGGYLLTGLSYSSDGDIDSLLVYDDADVFVVKCNASGVKEWAKTFGGNRFDKSRYITQDADSNILVVGGTHSVDGDIDSTHGNSELFVLKLDPSGNKLWMKQYGGTGFESGRYISQLASGNYLVTGYSTSINHDLTQNFGSHDGWLLMLDINGNIVWSKTIGGSGTERMRGFLPTSDGHFLVYGSSTSNDHQVTGNHGGGDFWLAKTDSLGNLLWSKLYGGSGDEVGYHLKETSDGNYLMAGYTTSNDGDVSGFRGDKDGWLIKIDSAGTLLNQICVGGSLIDRFFGVEEDSSGYILTMGYSRSTDFDLLGVKSNTSFDYWLALIDPNLSYLWSYCIGGSSSDIGEELLLNYSDSTLILMGDSKSNDGPVLNNHGEGDYWIVKIRNNLLVSTEQLDEVAYNCWYDQNKRTLIIRSSIHQILNLRIVGVDGREMYNYKNMPIEKGHNSIHINIPAGFYILNLYNNYRRYSYKFVHMN